MQISNQSAFTAFELTELEVLQGYNFSPATAAVLQNLLSEAAEELLVVRLDGKLDTEEERTKSAFTSGQISILKHILRTHQTVREQLGTTAEVDEHPV